MFEKLKNLFARRLKRTAEKNSGVNTSARPEALPEETLHQSGMSDSESAEDFDDSAAADSLDAARPKYKNTSDYCMIRPDASFNNDPDNDSTANSQSS